MSSNDKKHFSKLLKLKHKNLWNIDTHWQTNHKTLVKVVKHS